MPNLRRGWPRGDRVMKRVRDRAERAIAEWKDAYRDANGKEPPAVWYETGWVSFRGSADKKRLHELEGMTKVLRGRLRDA